MDGDFKRKLIKQALRLLRKGLKILERLFGHPPDQPISDSDPALLSEEWAPEAEGGGENTPKAARVPIRENGPEGGPNRQSNRIGQRQLQGAARDVFCRLMIDGHIGVMQVLACQTSNGHGTIRDRKRHAECTIAKIKRAIRGSGMTIRKRESGWGCYEWILVHDNLNQADSSVVRAYEIALQAQYNLDNCNYSKAMELAIQAVNTDDMVQLSYEVLCRAATEIVPADQVNMDRVRASRRVLAKRIEQIGRVRQIVENSLPDADEEALGKHLVDAEKNFAAEYKHVSGILMRLDSRFGALNARMSLADQGVHEAIVALRKGGSGLDDVEKQRLQNSIRVHPSVNRVFETIDRRCAHRTSASRDELRNRAKGIILALCWDPQIPANIRLICSKTEQMLRESLGAPRARCLEAQHYKEIGAASDEFYKKHGCPPSDEELADLTGLSLDQIRAARDWRRIKHPEPPDAVDWQKPKRKPKIEDEENHGPDDDDDDPLAGELVE